MGMDIQKNTLRTSQSAAERFMLPDPCCIVTIFRDARALMASRRELLPTFKRSHRMASFGSLSPGCKFSSNVNEIMSSAIFRERLFYLKFVI